MLARVLVVSMLVILLVVVVVVVVNHCGSSSGCRGSGGDAGGCSLEGIQLAQSQVSLRSFTWLSFMYFLKYKLAQNHFMTYPNLPEFGFPTIGIYSKLLKSSFFMKFKSIVPL